MVQKKRKETHTIERNMKKQTKSIKKTRRKKKEKEKERQKQKMVSKKWSKKEHITMENKKGSFCSKRETNERNEKERKVLWKEKKNDERERGPETRRKELRQR